MRDKIIVGLIGLVGGIVGGVLVSHRGAQNSQPLRSVQSAAAAGSITAHRFLLTDAAGKTRADLTITPEGATALFFYDSQGKTRLTVGLYSPAESELPFVVLNDSNQSAAGIFRLFGGTEAPVVVLKNKGRDRSVYGLNAGTLEPFLVNYSSTGTKQALFGNF